MTLAATLPARFAVRMAGVDLPADVAVTGTVWAGAATLPHGFQLNWSSRGLDSVAALALVADVQLTGPETDLAAGIAARPGDVTLAPMTGRIGWRALEATLPGLEITCATSADVNLAKVSVTPGLRSAIGQITLAEGTCARVDGTVKDVPMPAILAMIETSADGVTMAVAGSEAPEVPLGLLVLTPDDRLRITVFAAGAVLVPGLPTTGDSQIELPLALFLQ